MDEELARRLSVIEERYQSLQEYVQWLMHHSHIGGQYSEPVHIHLQPDRVISHKRDVFVESERTQPLESEPA